MKQGSFPRHGFVVHNFFSTMNPSDSLPASWHFRLMAYMLLLYDFSCRVGSLQFRTILSIHAAPPTPTGSSVLHQVLHTFYCLRPVLTGSTPVVSLAGALATLQVSLYVTACIFARTAYAVLYPSAWHPASLRRAGISYPAPWRLPGQDFHLLALFNLSGHTSTALDFFASFLYQDKKQDAPAENAPVPSNTQHPNDSPFPAAYSNLLTGTKPIENIQC